MTDFEVLTGDKAHEYMKKIMQEHEEYKKAHPHMFDKFGYKWNNKKTTKYLWEAVNYNYDVKNDESERYEECCRFMVSMGLEFLDKQKEDYPKDAKPKFASIRNVAGVSTPMNVNAEELRKFILHKVDDYFGKEFSPSGFQFQSVTGMIGWISEHSWEEHLQLQRKHREKKNKK